MSHSKCTIIIVTHNSQLHFSKCIEALKQQTLLPHQIIVVDSGSNQIDYLLPYQNEEKICLHLSRENIGFCQGNNLGMSLLPNFTDYVLFLNPDAFLTPNFLQAAIHHMESHPQVGALSGILLGYDIKQNQPTGKIDSTGIFQTWYGRWYDRDQGLTPSQLDSDRQFSVPALCGALMFCRKAALDQVLLKPNEIMDSSFYMYKEDIDLSLRLKQQGWNLIVLPHLQAYHCRGWQKDRSKVPRKLRLMAARNEVRLHARLRSPHTFYSTLKYLAVKLLNV